MKIYDISWPIFEGMTAYKDKSTVKIEALKTFEKDKVRESIITLGSHTGTHVDAPAHFMEQGEVLHQISPLTFSGPCVVLDLTNVEERIMREDLEAHTIEDGELVLLKTKNSDIPPTDPFNPKFVYLDITGAEYLAGKKVRAVGIDYLGIERNQPDHETHKELLGNNVGIIEGLRLDHVQAGQYFLWCLPLALIGTEAAPARAMLVQQ